MATQTSASPSPTPFCPPKADPTPRQTHRGGRYAEIETILDELIDDARGAVPGSPEEAMVRADRARLMVAIDTVANDR